MFFNWLKHKTARKQAAKRLYQTTRSQSRDPVLYERWGVADTMDGRFDALSLHVALLLGRLRRLGPEGHRLAQAVFDCMFRDIDQTLRETGIGDLGVPKHMAKMMKAFNGRAHVYSSALAARDTAALEIAIARNLYRADSVPAADVVAYVLSLHDALGAYSLEDLMRGDISYPPPPCTITAKEAAYA
jgi:cytochrome b pre-mRNA-processing protein 3